jgi:hypothetical protein
MKPKPSFLWRVRADRTTSCGERHKRMSVYVALHAFTAEQDGDVSFKRGDSILVRTPDDERDAHWWLGRVMDEDEDSDLDSDNDDLPVGRFPAHSVATEEEFDRDDGPGELEMLLVASHAYDGGGGENDEDLSFEEGAVLVGKELHGGWWTGSVQGESTVGFFPADYVHVSQVYRIGVVCCCCYCYRSRYRCL